MLSASPTPRSCTGTPSDTRLSIRESSGEDCDGRTRSSQAASLRVVPLIFGARLADDPADTVGAVWIRVLLLLGFTSFVESFTFNHVRVFMPLYLETLGLPAADIPRWVGLFGGARWIFGLPL